MGGTAVSGGNEFNYYIPIKITASPAFAFVALIKSYSTNPSISKIYKLAGSKELNHATMAIPSALFTFVTYASTNVTSYTVYGTL